MSRLVARLSLLTAAMLTTADASADVLSPLRGALTEAKPIVDARLRFEEVQQTPLVEEAEANTLRLRLGLETGRAWNTSLLAEAEAVVMLQDHYRADNSQPRDLAFPVVADPRSEEINRLQLTNASIPGTTITIGRQRIALDDHRFVGNVGWRQNEQTYDGVRVVNKSLPALSLDVAYVNQVNRIYGPDLPQGRYRGDVLLANAAYQISASKLTAFSYLLDFDPLTRFPGLTPAQSAALNPVRVSTQTYGLRFAGERPLQKFKVGYAGSYATQSDYAENPAAFTLDYYSIELTGTYRQYSLSVGQEVLEGNGTIGFSTPLATLHRFQGWADKFLTTPANGIDDRYASVGCLLKGIAMLDTLTVSLAYHQFEGERGAADLGAEVDVQIQAKYRRFLATLKYADYDATGVVVTPLYRDTSKLWLQVEYSW